MLLNAICEILRRPTLMGVLELAAMCAPLCLAALGGLLLGWAWRPRWASALGAGSVSGALETPSSSARESAHHKSGCAKSAVNTEDLRQLCQLVEETDGGPAWVKMMDRTLPTMSYRAWRRDPENGPPQYRSSSVFENASPETLRDFFWDDEFRRKNRWDNMLLEHEVLQENKENGTMVVRWVRKFPFFCSDREYIIGRRIWASGRTYYCVTKAVPCSDVPRRDDPRRVDSYYSSWCIRPVESAGGSGATTACEVLLFHHEDMGIPWKIAKFGVQQGMWGCVRRIEPGLRAYQASDERASRYSKMAGITTEFNANELMSADSHKLSSSTIVAKAEKQSQWASNIPKLVAIGGAVALAFTLDQGLVTKAVIFGLARRFVNPAKRL